MPLSHLIFWAFLGLNVLLVFCIVTNSPKEKLVVEKEVKYIKQECPKNEKIIYKCDKKGDFIVYLLSDANPSDAQEYENVALYGKIDDAGYESIFILHVNKYNPKNSYFKLKRCLSV